MKKKIVMILVIILAALLVLAGIWIYQRMQVSYYDGGILDWTGEIEK